MTQSPMDFKLRFPRLFHAPMQIHTYTKVHRGHDEIRLYKPGNQIFDVMKTLKSEPMFQNADKACSISSMLTNETVY